MGPGNKLDRTHRAEKAVLDSDIIVGYAPYLESIADLTSGKQCYSSGMRKEIERCTGAVEYACNGHTVSVISSGDSGIYGMAGLVLEILHRKGLDIPVEVVCGVSAANAAAAALGAPLMNDFAVISLSDLLVPLERIKKRLEALAALDMVTVIYNPKSKTRTEPFEMMVSIFSAHRSAETAVGIVTKASSEDEEVVTVTTLGKLRECQIGMSTTIIIGSGDVALLDGRMVSLRGYRLDGNRADHE
ncbi:precorrin-3B C(17)-methyltransferase [Chitinispirillales bacterium ANBcel5]|uniref:precorrin-3B C(17)-methyltransferase n=1 Tax=Cellulosispirillum alkaliphilum TaxID=3039283 RepID=UPI002A567C7F|nr:precorrin-3B C(17)-methyltransferase [Chitinispirillales bacterium ANBcel5]